MPTTDERAPVLNVCVHPAIPILEEAARAGGATIAGAEHADAIVWTNPRDPNGLRDLLANSTARWVQLPFAGIESFFAAGVIDPNITWTCAKGIYGHTTAEHALALMLAAARKLPDHLSTKSWLRDGDERTLAGTTVVIVGGGGIGRALVEMLIPLRTRCVVVSRSGSKVDGADATVTTAELGRAVREADWLVIAAALTEETHHLIDAKILSSMRPTAWIVNVARGGLIDQGALVEALQNRTVAGAALDVTDPEPLPDAHPLWTMDNVIITSHTANTFAMALPELSAMVTRNVQRFARGEPLEGLVDPALGY